MPTFKRFLSSAILLFTVFVLVWFVWIRGQELVATLILLFGATALAGWIYKNQAEAIQISEADRADAKPAVGPGLGLVIGFAAVACAWRAFHAAQAHDWSGLAIAILLGAVAWRFCLPASLPTLSRGASFWLMLIAVLTAAAFRLYKAGAVPEGFLGVDEALLWERSRAYLAGMRSTYGSGDGIIPYYFQAFGLQLFGDGFFGWRFESCLVGIGITAVMFRLGRNLAGPWVGFFASMLWAVCIWPVTVTRAPYFMGETYLMVLMCLMILTGALRSNRSLSFALAGLFWSFTFNVYPAARVMLVLVPWLLFLVWYLLPDNRKSLRRAWHPLLVGFLIGLVPLFLWLCQHQPWNMREYFAAFSQPIQIGAVGGTSLADFFNGLMQRCLWSLPGVFSSFVSTGTVCPFYFPFEFPFIQPALLLMFFLGFSVCLARFRNPLYAFLVYWWFAGLLPALLSAPGTVPNDRREMMAMPPMLLMGAVGVASSLGVFARGWRERSRPVLVGLIVTGMMAWFGIASWHTYFDRNQKSYSLLAWGRVNGVRVLRGIYDENAKGPVAVVSLRYDLNRQGEYSAVNPTVPLQQTQQNLDYYKTDGLFGALKRAIQLRQQGSKAGVLDGPPYDVLVVLAPGQFYLEPLLLRLGGKEAAEIPMARANEGLLRGDTSMGDDPSLVAKLVRLHGLTVEAVNALAAENLYQFKVQELLPPLGMTQDYVLHLFVGSPEYRKMLADYMANPGRWKLGPSVSFQIPDPWFWTYFGTLPMPAEAPFRLSTSFQLLIPKDGDYAFGSSASLLTTFRIDGKRVFQHDPTDPKTQALIPAGEFAKDPGLLDDEAQLRGYLGAPIHLSRGTHRLDLEQLCFSVNPSNLHMLRALWQAPGGGIETLPLEVMHPLPDGAKAH